MTALTLHQQAAVTDGLQIDTATYNIGVEFEVSSNCALTGMWWFSQTGAGQLPQTTSLFNANTQAIIPATTNSSPSWSGAAGSGWVRVAYPGTFTCVPGTKYEAVFWGGGAGNYYTLHQHFWDTGAGASGITNGALSAPNNASSVNGQEVFTAAASIGFPVGTFNALTFWTDVEVTPIVPGIAVAAPQQVTMRTEIISGSSGGMNRIIRM